ncbi:MAG: MBOAT family protein [Schleiferiaceae bacterium]
MLFNSLDFAVFLPIVFALYWFVTQKNLKLQNALIVLASYVFYGWWDWKFLSLIFVSTLVDYSIGLRIKKTENSKKRKYLLWTSLAVNLGFLGFFKYYNFFVESFVDAFSLMGMKFDIHTLNIILPVGISFYTFQTLSYTLDVYKKKLEPTSDFISFMAFVSFFPQLVAGPIERASNLLPQFYRHRKFELSQAVDGMRQILWGLFKKVVIADNCAEFVNEIFNHSDDYSGSTLALGAVFFAFQVYGDFSGYSDIAIGTSRLFGFNLKQNFATPYFSRNIMEFWKRWHISLTTWLTDYIFTPLALNFRHMGNWGIVLAIFITFFLSGLWHGANWTFIVWGLLHGLYFLVTIYFTKGKAPKGVVAKKTKLPSSKELFSMLLTFALVCFSYIFFRAESMNHAFSMVGEIFSLSVFSLPEILINGTLNGIWVILLLLFIVVEWLGRKEKYSLLSLLVGKPLWTRWILYYTLVFIIIQFSGPKQDFIYFQF